MDRRLASPRARGETVTEFALLAPILLLILFGIMELGRVVDAFVVVNNAAREGARVGVVTAGTSAAIASAATDAALDYVDTALGSRLDGTGDMPLAPTATTSVVGETVAVTVAANVKLYTPIMTTVLKTIVKSGGVPVSATATMRRQ